ncbi:MAG TPA: pseudouridine synthase [Burkholderiaceae bacterium]|nr:pseudouridine synthase [Burkholderiaceae bacterium]
MKKLTIAPRPAGGTRAASSTAPRPALRPAPGQAPRLAAGPNARRTAAAAPNPTGLATETGPELMRVSKRMSELGLASRREADEWIERGWVRVNGEVAQLGQKVTAADKITIERGAREQQAEQVTVLINKPIGYVSGQAEDGYEPAYTLVTAERRWAQDGSPREFHPRQLKHLVPAGRLDIDSTGLLVLTQDGRVARQLIGEDSDIEKEYLVRVVWHSTGGRSPREAFPARELARLNHGLALDGKPLKPARVEWENEDQLRFVLREGKKRQIRRMCELVGLKVVGLKRIRIGRVLLGNLPAGQWRYLAPGEAFA